MSGLRGRVRKAEPIDVSTRDEPAKTRTVPGGWTAEVVAPDGGVVECDNRADWRGAMATVWHLLRRYQVIP